MVMRIASVAAKLVVAAALFMGFGLAADAVNHHRGTSTGARELMAALLALIWIAGGGSVMFLFRHRVRAAVNAVPISHRVKFVLLATVMALLEEAITTTLTNLAPQFGGRIGEAFITASTNYLEVVIFHSVIVLIPMFAVWSWLLERCLFSTEAVFLLFGLNGVLAEILFGGATALVMAPFWISIYGLMIILPVYSLPRERGARPPRWFDFVVALVLPVVGAAALALMVSSLSPHLPHFGPQFNLPKITGQYDLAGTERAWATRISSCACSCGILRTPIMLNGRSAGDCPLGSGESSIFIPAGPRLSYQGLFQHLGPQSPLDVCDQFPHMTHLLSNDHRNLLRLEAFNKI